MTNEAPRRQFLWEGGVALGALGGLGALVGMNLFPQPRSAAGLSHRPWTDGLLTPAG